MALIFIFFDGIGLAPAAEYNPFATAAMPRLRALLGGSLTLESLQQRAGLLLKPVDACFGIAGLPQSGTGQTALLAGINAPAQIGRHQPHYPPTALRQVLAEQSVLRRARLRGLEVTFANPFTTGYWQALAERRIRRSASVIAVEGAGLRFRDLDDLAAGAAVPWDITAEHLRLTPETPAVPRLQPYAAGQSLAALARSHALVFYENFMPDLAGHGRLPLEPAQVLERIDGLLDGVLQSLQPHDNLLICSDHGNFEDLRTRSHTTNPVPLLVIGPAARAFAAAETIADLVEPILQVLV